MTLFATVLAGGCSEAPSPALRAERAVLEHEMERLSEYLEVDFGRLLVEGDLLVVVRERLVDRLLKGALPMERTLPGGHRVRLDDVRVRFRTALALVELRGRVFAAERRDTFADVVVHAALEVMGIAGEPPVLQARPRVLGLEARDVAVAGVSPPAERLIEELGRRRLADLEDALGILELPITLERSIVLPGVDADGVRIPALSLELSAAVDRVLVADRRLWVMLDLDLSDPPMRGSPREPQQADPAEARQGDGVAEGSP